MSGLWLDVADFLERARTVHVLRLSRNGRIDACNGAVAQHLGVPSEDIIGQSIDRFVIEADAQHILECLAEAHSGQMLLVNFCDAYHLPYTLECWFHFHDGGGTLIGEPPLKSDQRMQRDLMKVTQDLATLSRERTRIAEAERDARLQAEAASREKDRAIATLAHELRQPLGPMIVGLDLLKRSDTSPERRQRTLSTIERQATHLSRLVEDLLDAARIREKKLTLNRRTLDLRELLRDLAESFAGRTSERRIAFEVTLPAEPVWIAADSSRLAQVFSNLLENALKFSDPGGAISLTVDIHPGEASVRVRDRGRGIVPDVLPRIFEMFAQQADGEGGGLGIGLAVASGIVAMHGGTITALSDGPAKGSEFIVQLPVNNEEPDMHADVVQR